MDALSLRILHVVHDFLPRHRAGSELYVARLARAQAARHHVTILCATLDPARAHGTVRWRTYDGLRVAEVTNNWTFDRFEDTYASPGLAEVLSHVVRAVGPDVVHVHNLLNLTMTLPELARAAGAAVVATLHDYTLVCPSGGQRVHRAEAHVCTEIETARCARCFPESPFATNMGLSRLAGRRTQRLATPARWLRQLMPVAAGRVASTLARTAQRGPSPADIELRLAAARRVFGSVGCFVAPSRAMAAEYERLGLPSGRLEVSDYGVAPFVPPPPPTLTSRLRLGFVGTLVWHKGLHILLDALRRLPADRVELHVFGDLDTFPDYTRDARQRAQGLAVTFHGPFGDGDRSKVYGTFDVLVVPSIWPENSPFVVHEAFLARRPVIAARMGGLPELVADGVCGRLYEATSAAELAAAIEELLATPGTLRRWIQAIPPVKALDDDVQEWEARYRTFVGRRTPVEQPA